MIDPKLLIFRIVLFVVALAVLVILTFIPVIAPVPPFQFSKVFPDSVLVTEAVPASVFIQPKIVADPFTVIFEKLLLLLFTTTLLLLVAAVLVNKVIAPLAAARVNEVTILLLFTFWIPFAGIITLFAINVMAPVVFTFNAVKVFPLIV